MQRKVPSCREKFTHFHAKKSSRTFMQRKFHALSCREKFTHFHAEKRSRTFMKRKVHAHGKSYGWFMVLVRQFFILWFWSMVFSPWYLNLWFGAMVSHHKCWSQVLGPWYWIVMVFGPCYYKRPKAIKEEGDHLARHLLNYWISEKVLDLEYYD